MGDSVFKNYKGLHWLVRLLAGGQDPIFFASSDFGLFDPKKEENNLQIGAQGGATGRRHPMRPFLAPIQ